MEAGDAQAGGAARPASGASPPPPPQAAPPPPPPPANSRPPPPPTNLASLPADLIGEILLRVPRPGPASLSHRSLAAVLGEGAFRHRHRQLHRSARRSLGAWAMGDQAGMAMMAAFAVALRDRARHRAAGVEWVPPVGVVPGGGHSSSMRVTFVPGG